MTDLLEVFAEKLVSNLMASANSLKED